MASLREELEATIDKSEQTEGEPVTNEEPVVEEPVEQTTETVEKPVEEPEAKQEAAEPVEVKEEPKPKPGVKAEPEEEAIPAPKSWKPAIREKWSKLPKDVKTEIARREKQIMHEFGVNNEARQIANGFARAVQPYQARIRSLNISPINAVEELLKADHMLSTSPPRQRAQYMANLIRQYGVDIKELDSALAGEAPSGQNQALEQMLQQRLAPIQKYVQQQQQLQQQQELAKRQHAVTTIQAMAADSKKYPYFEDVRQDMADLMEVASRRGLVLTPEEAYEKAVKINPDTAPLVQRQQMSQLQRKQSQAAQAAKKASQSVAGSPSTAVTSDSDNSLRGTLEAAIAQASGR